MIISEDRINRIIKEEITKNEVNSIVSDRISSSYNSKEFERRVKKIVADAMVNLYKTLYNRSSSWKGGVER